MARWSEIEAEVPEFAARAKAFFDARTHKTIATIRADGSPRISGIECLFVDGEMWFGSMWRATKALDLIRDPRFAFHSGAVDPPEWTGDAKIAGNAVEVTDPDVVASVVSAPPPGPFHLFKANIHEAVIVSLAPGHTHLVVDLWLEGGGLKSFNR